MILSFAIILCGCEKNTSPIVEDTQITIQTEQKEDILISEPPETQPIQVAQIRLKSIDDYKLFIDKEKRNDIFQNHEIPLSDSDIKRLCEISDNIINETVYIVSDSKEYIGCLIEDTSYTHMFDYVCHYQYENFFVEFQIPIDKKARITLIEEGIIEFFENYIILTETEDGYISSDNRTFIPTEITIENQTIDAFYVLNSNRTTCFYFELSGQLVQVYMNAPTTFNEDLRLAESLGIHKLNLDESLTQ